MKMNDPWSALHATLHQTLRDRALLPPKSRILIAVSGGQDSLCLAQLLLDLQRHWAWQLAIVHCDHGWRSDSEQNAEHIALLATTWGLPFLVHDAHSDVSTEAKAREWRYTCFQTSAQDGNYSHIVTGHTASDRAETLLYNLVRGSGSDGLQALQWQRKLTPNLWLVRPLLAFSRQQTGDFCSERSLPVWLDSTNEDLRYDRNRIRHQILPQLRDGLNSRVELHLAQTAEILHAEVTYLEQQVDELYAQIVQADSSGDLHLDRTLAASLPIALQRRLLRRFFLTALRFSPTFDQIESCLSLFTAPNRTASASLTRGYRLEGQQDWLVITR